MQLVENITDVTFSCLVTQYQSGCNFRVAQAFT
jgi:hypothetical protein